MNYLPAILLCAACIAPGALQASDAPSRYLMDSIPQTWELDNQPLQPSPESDAWWSTLSDPTLNSLIALAVKNNYNVAAATHRIEAAAAVERQTRALFFPTVSASAGWVRDQPAGAVSNRNGRPAAGTYFSAGLALNWQIDLFGRVNARLKADRADYEASEAEYRGVLVTLAANVAKAYFDLRLAQAELDVTQHNVGSAEDLLDLAQTRYEVGLVPALDMLQARITVTQTRATLPAINADIESAINRLSILVGQYPSQLAYLRDPAPLPETPPVTVGCNPPDLLRRRPDIMQAERQVAAAAAQVGIAKKDFLPFLSLTATVGTEGRELKWLFGRNSLYYNVSPTLTWTVFDGMARSARVAQARAQMKALVDEYNLTVMTAVQEANNALVAWQTACDQYIYREMLFRDSRRQLELQTDRYKQGLNDFTDVQNAQMQVFNYQNAMVEAHASQLTAMVTLYAALGGGWK